MSSDAAAKFVRRFYKQFGAGRIDAALSVFADDLEVIDPAMGRVRGRDRFREYLEDVQARNARCEREVEETVESGELVAVEGRVAGTHTSPLATNVAEVSPTGAAIDLRFADVSRMREGKIVAYRTYYDQLGLVTQLGLMDQSS
jgi:steroid delta-isomerase-like uncharacterized protein